MTFIYIDTETTGTDPEKHAVIQIAGIVVTDGKEVERFNIRMKPFEGQLINAESLAVNGLLEKDIFEYPDPRLGYQELRRIFQAAGKCFMVGWNVRFDHDFISALFKNCGDDGFYKMIFWPAIDVAVLAEYALIRERQGMQNFKQSTIARFLGVEFEEKNLHDAMEDIRITREIMLKIVPKLRSI